MATLTCRGIPDRGLVLIGPDQPGFAGLAADIRSCVLAGPIPTFFGRGMPDDLQATAILENRAAKAIVATAFDWTLELDNGRTTHSRHSVANHSLLLPLETPIASVPILRYWGEIFPGSRRLVSENGVYGNNTDVRAPGPEEMWKGGAMGAISGPARRPPVLSRVLTLDGAFFVDGEFTGPNQNGLWEQINLEIDVRLEAAKIARAGHDRGFSSSRILEDVTAFTGPAPTPGVPPSASRAGEMIRRSVAMGIQSTRTHHGDDAAVHQLLAWLDVPRPTLRRT